MKAGKRQSAWRCHTCGEVLTSYAKAERHMDAHGGGRLECVQGTMNPSAARTEQSRGLCE